VPSAITCSASRAGNIDFQRRIGFSHGRAGCARPRRDEPYVSRPCALKSNCGFARQRS
jgi:hypothetical protein